jgi:hypothetical protein
MSGWVSIHRKMMDKRSYFSEPFCRNMAWVDMILLANHDKNWFRCRGLKVEVYRGQIGFGLEELAKRWMWSRGKVERFMKELEFERQIVRQKNNITTLITIVNYNQYQTFDKANDNADSKASSNTNGQQTVKQTDINNNVNNDNNVNKNLLLGQKNKNFNTKPFATDFNGLPEQYINTSIERVHLHSQISISKETTLKMWEIFKVQKLTGEEYHANEGKVYNYFVDWIKFQKFSKNDTNKSALGNPGKTIEFDKP